MRALLAGTALLAAAACGGGGDDEQPSPLVAVSDVGSAKQVAGAVANTVSDLVPVGTYNNHVVVGQSGSALVSGNKTYSGSQSCGSSCVSSRHTANLTIVFSDYYGTPAAGSTNTKVRLSGTVTFTDSRSSTQNGLSFSSSGRQTVSGGALAVRYEITNNGAVTGYADTVAAMTTSSTTGSSWSSGSLQASNGVTYRW